MNISETIIPKSDQLNADDLIGGPMIITVTDAKAGSQDQPVHVIYEGCGERVYKPNKTMRKILASCWGAETDNWIGRSMNLDRDPAVKWGGVQVGGIVIKALTDIKETRRLCLNESRNKKKEYVIEVLDNVEPPKKKKVDPLKDLKTELMDTAIRTKIVNPDFDKTNKAEALGRYLESEGLIFEDETLSSLTETRLREIIERIDS